MVALGIDIAIQIEVLGTVAVVVMELFVAVAMDLFVAVAMELFVVLMMDLVFATVMPSVIDIEVVFVAAIGSQLVLDVVVIAFVIVVLIEPAEKKQIDLGLCIEHGSLIPIFACKLSKERNILNKISRNQGKLEDALELWLHFYRNGSKL